MGYAFFEILTAFLAVYGLYVLLHTAGAFLDRRFGFPAYTEEDRKDDGGDDGKKR